MQHSIWMEMDLRDNKVQIIKINAPAEFSILSDRQAAARFVLSAKKAGARLPFYRTKLSRRLTEQQNGGGDDRGVAPGFIDGGLSYIARCNNFSTESINLFFFVP